MRELDKDLPARSLRDQLLETVVFVEAKIINKELLESMFGLICHKHAVRDSSIWERVTIEHFCKLLLVNVVLDLKGFETESYAVGSFFASRTDYRHSFYDAEICAHR